jgi:ABC-type sulfate transport system permease component
VLPLAALTWASTKDGARGFWQAVSSSEGVAALELTLGMSLLV